MKRPMFLFGLLLLVTTFIAACNTTDPGGPSFKLTVNASGTGSGTVTSAPAGINCGSDCDETYTQDTEVTLTAEATSGSTFSGWSGAGCAGTGTCTVKMDGIKTVTATFTKEGDPDPEPNPDGPFLFRAIIESGQGTITTADGKINCVDNTGDCEETYAAGTEVVVTATAGTGFVFKRFSGSSCTADATNENVCTYEMSKARDSRVYFGIEGADEFPVASSSDDAEEYVTAGNGQVVGFVDLTSSDLELNYDEGAQVNQLVGIRFSGVTTATDKVIKEVYIEFQAKARDLTIPSLTIKAEANAAPSTFGESLNNISNRTLTEQSVSWAPAAWEEGDITGDTRTPNLKSLLDASGWTSGGSVVFVISGDGTDAQRRAYSYNQSGNTKPTLVIVYE